eukprot:TRINITY_DN124269_c0_g1_i1.p1 TRINITY_DN124269_c0_g1~~TRINITY_DN124269_c0_g1_i1.p1  ORF type:complete len:327 (-),score=65.34 TRINITY_DN124269_c0_g1_i1:228-1208(-)
MSFEPISVLAGTHIKVEHGQQGPNLRPILPGERYDPRTLRYYETRHAMDGQLIRKEQMDQLDEAMRNAVDSTVALGFVVPEDMKARVKLRTQGLLSNPETTLEDLRDTAQKRIFSELAVADAARGADEDGHVVTPAMLANASSIVVPSGSSIEVYEAAREKAQDALHACNLVYVVTILGYKRSGLDLTFNLRTLGSSFTLTAPMDTTVGDFTSKIREDQQLRSTRGAAADVKVVGPAGTVLDPARTLPHAVDYETDGRNKENEAGEFYDLEVLTGEAWKELGLDGPTRWRYLQETEFVRVFGMSKWSFSKLAPWTQTSLKKKHGLF